jgi:hypothetical protein
MSDSFLNNNSITTSLHENKNFIYASDDLDDRPTIPMVKTKEGETGVLSAYHVPLQYGQSGKDAG